MTKARPPVGNVEKKQSSSSLHRSHSTQSMSRDSDKKVPKRRDSLLKSVGKSVGKRFKVYHNDLFMY